MFRRSKTASTFDDRLAELTKRHRSRLKDGEAFVALCEGFAPDQPHADSIVRGASDEELRLAASAHLRLASVRTALGMGDEEFSELPPSGNGYVLAHTGQRLFIFDGSAKMYQLQSPIKGLWLQAVDHGDGSYTLVFSDGDERVAVATARESATATLRFIESFPDRRSKPRVIALDGQPRVTEF